MAFTEEKEMSLQEAVRLLSENLNQHATTVRTLQQTVESIQPQFEKEVKALRSHFQKDVDTFLADTRSFREALSEIRQIIGQKYTTSTNTERNVHRSSQQSSSSEQPEDTHIQLTASASNTIIVPPISSFPTFSGKPTDRPRQFLLRVAEYTRTVNKWSTDTLLKGISQFLKDSALEWYCQLHASENLPTDWDQFVLRFLAQFHSPIRIAQQEHEWDECKQMDNETINEFIVRLRSLWLEQKAEIRD